MKRVFFRGVLPIIFLALLSAAVMLLWNFVIPSVIGWGALNYLQSIALVILSRLLLGKLGTGFRHNSGGKEELRNKLKGMSREERREHIKSYMQNNEQ